jgi:hypothetical protein
LHVTRVRLNKRLPRQIFSKFVTEDYGGRLRKRAPSGIKLLCVVSTNTAEADNSSSSRNHLRIIKCRKYTWKYIERVPTIQDDGDKVRTPSNSEYTEVFGFIKKTSYTTENCIYSTYYPLAPYTLSCSDFFNIPKRNYFCCAANSKTGKTKDISPTLRNIITQNVNVMPVSVT